MTSAQPQRLGPSCELTSPLVWAWMAALGTRTVMLAHRCGSAAGSLLPTTYEGITSNERLTRPVQVTFMAWGRHSGWHWMHSEFSTNSLGSLSKETTLISTVSSDPAQNAWRLQPAEVTRLKFRVIQNPLSRQCRKISGQHVNTRNLGLHCNIIN